MNSATEVPLDQYLHADDQKKSLTLNTTGLILTGITGTVAVALTVISAPFVSPALRKHCLPYVPATTAQVRNVLSALKNRQGNIVDLGSGDGRIVLETAKHNFQSHGVELNPWLVTYSKLDAFRKGLGSRTRFFRKDLWKFSLQPYDNVVIFGVDQMMSDLEKKILLECKGSCNVIACRFPLPTLEPQQIIGQGVDTVWVYELSKANI